MNYLRHTKITNSERQLLANWLKSGISKKECARRLGRNIKSVRREINRNSIRVAVGTGWEYIYEPNHAQAMADKRKRNAWFAKQPLKNKKIYSFVLKHLRKGWSPEQIAGRLKHFHPRNPSWQICHETIYQFIYKPKTDITQRGLIDQAVMDRRKSKRLLTVTQHSRPLWEYLRRKQTKRRKRNGRKVRRVRIPDRVSINQRPKEVEKRKRLGHWEGDSIVGANHQSGLHTEYERVTSLIKIAKMKRVDSTSFVKATTSIFSKLPNKAKLSTTLDNGSEHVRHATLKNYGMDVYFADAYASWQRGGNENANLWIRYYFPKGTDFSTISAQEIKEVEKELNNRPRKRLGFKTPLEVFDEKLNSS